MRINIDPSLHRLHEALVECGFQWLGRADDAEGGAFGCDPMHFELEL